MRSFLGECFGTFGIVFFGTGAIVCNQEMDGIFGQFGIALTFGLAVMAMILLFRKFSEAHFNPAVSISLWRAGKFSKQDLVYYLLAQVSGAILASFLLYKLFPQNQYLGSTLPQGGLWISFALEVFLTFILMLFILWLPASSKTIQRFSSGIIGLIIFLEAYFAGPICGASMNPFRSLAPAVVSGHTEHVWLYLLAPTLGALASVPVYHRIKK